MQTKLPQLKRLSPFPNLFMKNSRVKSNSIRIQELSKISAYRPRNTSEEGHSFRSALHVTQQHEQPPPQSDIHRTISVVDAHEKSIESSLLAYAEDKKRRTNFRKNKFVRADQD